MRRIIRFYRVLAARNHVNDLLLHIKEADKYMIIRNWLPIQ